MIGCSATSASMACRVAQGVLAYPVARLIDQGPECWLMTAGSLLAGTSLHFFVCFPLDALILKEAPKLFAQVHTNWTNGGYRAFQV